MKSYRLALLCKEFSFVDRLFTDESGNIDVYPEDVTDIKIRRGDNSLLEKTGFRDSYSWSGGGHCDYTTYFAIWDEGDNKEQILELEDSGSSASGSGESQSWEANTIGEQLFAKKIVPDYIVECIKNDHDNNGNGRVTRFWTIYKMKQFDLLAFHQDRIDEAAATLKAEIAAACA